MKDYNWKLKVASGVGKVMTCQVEYYDNNGNLVATAVMVIVQHRAAGAKGILNIYNGDGEERAEIEYFGDMMEMIYRMQVKLAELELHYRLDNAKCL